MAEWVAAGSMILNFDGITVMGTMRTEELAKEVVDRHNGREDLGRLVTHTAEGSARRAASTVVEMLFEEVLAEPGTYQLRSGTRYVSQGAMQMIVDRAVKEAL